MTKRIMLLTGFVVGILLLGACSSSSSGDTTTATGAPVGGDSEVSSSSSGDTTTTAAAPAGGDGEVSIKNFAFGPDDITVSVGDTITWTNDESVIGHTTTSDDGIWNSELLSPGDTFEQTFDEAGTFTYFCSIHPAMTASITVNG